MGLGRILGSAEVHRGKCPPRQQGNVAIFQRYVDTKGEGLNALREVAKFIGVDAAFA